MLGKEPNKWLQGLHAPCYLPYNGTARKYPRFKPRHSEKKNHLTGTLFEVWALFDTLNNRKHSEPSPKNSGKTELLDVVHSFLHRHQATYNCMSTKNKMVCWNSSMMMHDINLQHLWDRIHRKAHVRLYVNWPLNTSIAMLTESAKQP